MNIEEVKKIPLEDFLGRAGSRLSEDRGTVYGTFRLSGRSVPRHSRSPFLEPVT